MDILDRLKNEWSSEYALQPSNDSARKVVIEIQALKKEAANEIESLRQQLADAQLQRERQAQPTSQDVDEYIERLEESLKDAIRLRVALFRGGDFEGDTDKLPDNEIINRESYARKWQKALDSRPDAAMKESK